MTKEYIDRGVVIHALMNIPNTPKQTFDVVCGAPAADVAPVVPGEWLDDGTGSHLCKNCGCYADYDEYEMDVRDKKREHLSPYCPNCGAKMDGGAENG